MNGFARHRVLLVSTALVLLGAIVPYLIWGDALEAAEPAWALGLSVVVPVALWLAARRWFPR